jgi:hypothetical protein
MAANTGNGRYNAGGRPARRVIGRLAVPTLGLLLSTGCGAPATVVSGVVTLDGEIVSGASVQLYPVGGKGQPAGATTDDAGRFRARVSPVPLRVLVSKRTFGGYVADPLDPTGEKIAVVDELLPARYASLETTPLTVDPVAERTTAIDLSLTKTPEPGTAKP